MFYSELNRFNTINPRKGCTKEKKVIVHGNASEIYNEYLEIYFNQYMTLSDAKRESWVINILKKLFLEAYGYSMWSKKKEESTDKEESIDLSDLPPVEGDEQVKGKGLKILTPKT